MRRYAAVVFLLLASSDTMAQQQLLAIARPRTGNDLREICDVSNLAECIGYLEGIIDSEKSRSFCVPIEVSGYQGAVIVRDYLRRHSELWRQPAVTIVSNAFSERYRC